jgi:hypothetical protein
VYDYILHNRKLTHQKHRTSWNTLWYSDHALVLATLYVKKNDSRPRWQTANSRRKPIRTAEDIDAASAGISKENESTLLRLSPIEFDNTCAQYAIVSNAGQKPIKPFVSDELIRLIKAKKEARSAVRGMENKIVTGASAASLMAKKEALKDITKRARQQSRLDKKAYAEKQAEEISRANAIGNTKCVFEKAKQIMGRRSKAPYFDDQEEPAIAMYYENIFAISVHPISRRTLVMSLIMMIIRTTQVNSIDFLVKRAKGVGQQMLSTAMCQENH